LIDKIYVKPYENWLLEVGSNHRQTD